MKLKSASWILFILTALSVTSCTIEKRLFQPGYRVEWKKKIPEKTSDESASLIPESKKAADSIVINSGSSIETQLAEPSISEKISSGEEAETTVGYPDYTKTDCSTAIPNTEPETPAYVDQKKQPDITEDGEEKEFELFGIMSFGIYFGSLILAVLSLIFSEIVIIIPAIIFLLLSLIFGIISVRNYHRNPEKYYRNGFGYFGLYASLATITIALLIIILIQGLLSTQ